MLTIARTARRQAERVGRALQQQGTTQATRLADQIARVLPLVEQVIDQAERRVLRGEPVPADEKLASLFEPHTQVIRRCKPGKLVEFGRKVILDEVEGGIISGFAIAERPGQDQPYLHASLAGHRRRFGRSPTLLAGDRGFASAENERLAREAGIKRIVLPVAGRATAEQRARERQRWFRQGFRFRAGIEGRVRVLKRGDELGRCRDHGADGLGRWVGWGIVTANLVTIARTIAARPAHHPTRRPTRPRPRVA